MAIWKGWRLETVRAKNAEDSANEKAFAAKTAGDRAKAEVAHSNVLRLAAQAALRQGDEFDLGLLLSVEAYRAEDSYETFSTLFAATRANPGLLRDHHGHKGAVTSATSTQTVGLSPPAPATGPSSSGT